MERGNKNRTNNKRMKKVIATLQNCPITRYYGETKGIETIDFTADMDIDADGSGGNPWHDKYFQADTSLHYKGKALDSSKVPYIVVPPVVISATTGIVLGSHCVVFNFNNSMWTQAVVGDLGPSLKVGEGSMALAKLLGIDPNPNTGGEDTQTINYRIFVGIPATVQGITYDLQSYKDVLARA
jgi:hypothetical protein